MKTTISLSSLTIVLCLLLSTSLTLAQSTIATSDIPRTISYQGLLTNNDGTPLLDGQYQITISLHSSPGGADILWKDTYLTSVNNGIFNINIGAGSKPLPDPASMNTPLWIGTQVGDSPEMYPLTPLSASPYALNVSDNAITTGKLADGAVTAEKVDMNYISAVEINDQKVSGVGTVLRLKSSDEITLNYDESTNSVTIASNAASKNSSAGDPEKGGKVLDNTDAFENWKGRTNAANALTFSPSVGTYNTLAGGASNIIDAATYYSTITGGQSNHITGYTQHGFIGGGQTNLINGIITATTEHATIAGGEYNIIDNDADRSTIAGGGNNRVLASSLNGAVGGGRWNTIWESTLSSTISGGDHNTILFLSDYSTIGGGESNTIGILGGGTGVDWATIGGGNENEATGQYSTIPGGDHLETTSYGQTAVGYYNASRGNLISRPDFITRSFIDDPLFMVGNGSETLGLPFSDRSNAFEVSYNGHTVVYGTNGARIPFIGATFIDNIVYSWGNITGGGTITSNFGVASVAHVPGSGIYDIRIQIMDPQTGAPITLTASSVTATIKDLSDATPCAFITASELGAVGPNTFRIRIRNTNCQPLDAHFMFKVTGRP